MYRVLYDLINIQCFCLVQSTTHCSGHLCPRTWNVDKDPRSKVPLQSYRGLTTSVEHMEYDEWCYFVFEKSQRNLKPLFYLVQTQGTD